MKVFKITALLFFGSLIATQLSGCNKSSTTQELSQLEPRFTQEHKLLEKSLTQFDLRCKNNQSSGLDCTKTKYNFKSATKGSSPEGKWLFTIARKDRKLFPGVYVVKGQQNPATGQIQAVGNHLNPEQIPPAKIVYAGFTSLSKSNGKLEGFDVISNFNNKAFYLSETKQNGNSLSWTLKYTPSAGEDNFANAMTFKTTARYLAERDILVGRTEFGMEIVNSVVEMKNGKINVKEQPKSHFVPMGSYLWRGSRLEESTFKYLTRPGVFNLQLPMYIVGLDTSHPEITKQLVK
jgi:hypothetical protein